MKTLLSLALFSLLLNAMTFCASDSKSDSSDSKTNSKSVSRNQDVRNFKVVHVYYPPGKENEEDYTDIENAVLFSMENGTAIDTIIDYSTRTKIVYVPRPRKKKDNVIRLSPEQVEILASINGKVNESTGFSPNNQSDYNHYFTAKSVSHANVPEYAKSGHSASANGQTLESAKRLAYEMLLSQLTNEFNQLFNYNKYCDQELSDADKLLDNIYYLADKAKGEEEHRYLDKISKLIKEWRSRTLLNRDNYKENNEYHFLGNSNELKKMVSQKQNSVDRQLELDFDNTSKMNATKKCIDMISHNLHLYDSDCARSIRGYIIARNTKCNEIDNMRYGK